MGHCNPFCGVHRPGRVDVSAQGSDPVSLKCVKFMAVFYLEVRRHVQISAIFLLEPFGVGKEGTAMSSQVLDFRC